MQSTTNSDAAVRVYEIETCLGRGAFGEVYRAQMIDGGLRQTVALKVLAPAVVDPNAQSAERLRDEAMFLGSLRHKALPKVYTITELEGRLTLVMEYIEGEDGTKLVRAGVPASAAVEIVAELAGALHAAHTAELGGSGIVHRDVKPGNFMLSRDGAVKLMDFGIASAGAEVRTARTQTDMMVGSVQYMAPERFTSPEAHPAWDIYALGQILYETCARRSLWKGMTQEMIFRHAFDAASHATHVRAQVEALDVDEDVAGLVLDCLAHDPSQRPSAHTLEVRCRRLMRTLPGQSLWEWVHGHDWTEPAEQEGPLVGQRLHDGTLAQPQPSAPPSVAPSVSASPAPSLAESVPRGAGWLVGGALLGVLAVAGLAVGVAASTALPLSSLGTAPVGEGIAAEDGSAAEAEAGTAEAAGTALRGAASGEAAGTEPADAASGEEAGSTEPAGAASGEEAGSEPASATSAPTVTPSPAAPEPEPPAATARPAPTAAPTSAPTPKSAPAPKRAPVPKSAPVPTAAAAMAHATLEGPGVELRGASGSFSASGELPAGTYAIYADFGTGEMAAGTVTLAAGQRLKVSCNAILEKCLVD